MATSDPEGRWDSGSAVARFLAEVWAHAVPASAAARLKRRYAVIHCGRDWRVLTSAAQIGPFQDQTQAMSVATNLTAQALQEGHAAELYAQCEAYDFSLRPVFRPDPVS
jgi:hypothetical protein